MSKIIIKLTVPSRLKLFYKEEWKKILLERWRLAQSIRSTIYAMINRWTRYSSMTSTIRPYT